MNKLLALFTLLLASVAFNGNAVEAIVTPTQLTEKYVNKEKNYSIQYPEKWQKKDVPQLDLVLFAPPQPGNIQTHASMNIVSEKASSTINLDQFYSESVRNLSTELKDMHVENSGEQTKNDLKSKWVLYTHKMQGLKFDVLQYFLVDNNTVYLITFSSLADDFTKFKPIFEEMASSFQLLNKATPETTP